MIPVVPPVRTVRNIHDARPLLAAAQARAANRPLVALFATLQHIRNVVLARLSRRITGALALVAQRSVLLLPAVCATTAQARHRFVSEFVATWPALAKRGIASGKSGPAFDVLPWYRRPSEFPMGNTSEIARQFAAGR